MASLPPLIDLHQDLSMYYIVGPGGQGFEVADFGKDLPRRHADIPKLRRSNTRLFVGSIFPMLSSLDARLSSRLSGGYKSTYRAFSPTGSSGNVISHFKAYYSLVESHRGALVLVRRRQDLERCMEEARGATGVLMALEGAEGVEDTGDIRVLYNLGLRALGFVWNYDTRYAASCMSSKDYGLTGEGEDLLAYMNDLGMIVDLAHSSKATCVDVFKKSKLPVMVSHANAKRIFDCARNVDDEVLSLLRAHGGVVGFVVAREMIGKRFDAEHLINHIMYVYDNFGPEILSIGTDYFGLGDHQAPPGLEDITKFTGVWRQLLDKGMKESDVEKLSYRNALRVIEANAARWKAFA